jgi:hypothetical protein
MTALPTLSTQILTCIAANERAHFDNKAAASTCPECAGDGWIVDVDAECCGRSDWECGGRGCTGPEQVQVQVQCLYCGGSGEVPSAFILAGLTQQLRSELAALERDIALPCGGPFGTQGRWGPNGREPGVRDLIRRSEREREMALRSVA